MGWALGRAAQETGDAKVFVDIRPVDAFAVAEQFEILTLIGTGVQKSRKPNKGH